MKKKMLFWSAILFLMIGLNTKDGLLYYFFSVHLFMLYIGVFLHKVTYTPPSDANAEPLPQAESAKK
jgi:membrane protein insertase Oxa1/YidC/SpoIIIJ